MNSFAPTCPDDGRSHRPLLSAIGAGIARAVLWPSRVLEARRTLSQLAGLSEYELRFHIRIGDQLGAILVIDLVLHVAVIHFR